MCGCRRVCVGACARARARARVARARVSSNYTPYIVDTDSATLSECWIVAVVLRHRGFICKISIRLSTKTCTVSSKREWEYLRPWGGTRRRRQAREDWLERALYAVYLYALREMALGFLVWLGKRIHAIW